MIIEGILLWAKREEVCDPQVKIDVTERQVRVVIVKGHISPRDTYFTDKVDIRENLNILKNLVLEDETEQKNTLYTVLKILDLSVTRRVVKRTTQIIGKERVSSRLRRPI